MAIQTHSKTLSTILIVLSLLIPSASSAQSSRTYGDFHDVQYLRNYDGDTITFNISGVHPLLGDHISVRVNGIDTPEIAGKCPREKELAQQAKEIVGDLLANARSVTLKDVGRGKYFRIVAIVLVDGQDIREVLIKRGLAVWYDGGRKIHNWCE